MGFISWFTIRIIGITKLAGKRRRERKELRKIEKEAYMQHKNIKEADFVDYSTVIDILDIS